MHQRTIPPSMTEHPARRAARIVLALAALSLGACSALITHPKPTASWTQRSGQVKFSSASNNVVGDIVIRHDADNFLAEITKGPGVRLLTLSAQFGTGKSKVLTERHALIVRATGPLARGGWTWNPESLAKRGTDDPKLADSSRVWAALPEVFAWAEAKAKGGEFRVCFPNIVIHARSPEGEVGRFDYQRVEIPSTGASLADIMPKDRKKLRVIESVVCNLDK